MHFTKAKHILSLLICCFMLCITNRLSAEAYITPVNQAPACESSRIEKDVLKTTFVNDEETAFYKSASSKSFQNRIRLKFRHVRNSSVQTAKPASGWWYHVFGNIEAARVYYNHGTLRLPYYYTFLFRLTPF